MDLEKRKIDLCVVNGELPRNLDKIHGRLGQKVQIGLENATVMAYTVRPGGDIRYEIAFLENGTQKVIYLTAFALAEAERETAEKPGNVKV